MGSMGDDRLCVTSVMDNPFLCLLTCQFAHSVPQKVWSKMSNAFFQEFVYTSCRCSLLTNYKKFANISDKRSFGDSS